MDSRYTQTGLAFTLNTHNTTMDLFDFMLNHKLTSLYPGTLTWIHGQYIYTQTGLAQYGSSKMSLYIIRKKKISKTFGVICSYIYTTYQ